MAVAGVFDPGYSSLKVAPTFDYFFYFAFVGVKRTAWLLRSVEAPLKMSLERAIEYIGPDEFVEAAPKLLRLRKRILDATARKRATAVVA